MQKQNVFLANMDIVMLLGIVLRVGNAILKQRDVRENYVILRKSAARGMIV